MTASASERLSAQISATEIVPAETGQGQPIRILDAQITGLDMAGLIQSIQSGVETKGSRVIAHHNLHSLYLFHRRPSFRHFYRNLVTCAPLTECP